LLESLINLSDTSQDLVYTFTDTEAGILDTYAMDGRFALAFDPDCHFYNCGIELEIITETQGVPEPAGLWLMALGGLALIRRSKRSSRIALRL